MFGVYFYVNIGMRYVPRALYFKTEYMAKVAATHTEGHIRIIPPDESEILVARHGVSDAFVEKYWKK